MTRAEATHSETCQRRKQLPTFGMTMNEARCIHDGWSGLRGHTISVCLVEEILTGMEGEEEKTHFPGNVPLQGQPNNKGAQTLGLGLPINLLLLVHVTLVKFTVFSQRRKEGGKTCGSYKRFFLSITKR